MILDYFDDNDYIAHVGTPHEGNTPHSGRYAWGSGVNPSQHTYGIYDYINKCRAKGQSDEDILKTINGGRDDRWAMGLRQYRAKYTADRVNYRNAQISKVKESMERNNGNKSKVAKELGLAGPSTVDGLLNENRKSNTEVIEHTAQMLKDLVDEHGTVDVGAFSNLRMPFKVSPDKFAAAIELIADEGYYKQTQNFIPVNAKGGKPMTLSVLTKYPGGGEAYKKATKEELDADRARVFKDIQNEKLPNVINEVYTEDGGRSWQGIKHPVAISRKRVYIKYGDDEDSGTPKDGLIEIRPGVEDLNMGDNKYSQVRINVEDRGYLKGMAIYSNNIPDGYDIVVNSNKKRVKGDFGNAIKDFKTKKDAKGNEVIDWDNPFGSSLKMDEYDDNGELVSSSAQRTYIGKDGKKHQSALNILREEGDWGEWSRSLPSQFLSKQDPNLAEKQLNLQYEKKLREFDEIMNLENPEIRNKLLEDFADGCNTATQSLKAAPMPGQATKVLIPINSLKDNEIYAPSYPDGTIVSLIRYPHAGTFEIPTLIVNNKNKEGISYLGRTPKDAVGIPHKAAEQLSGADFDGDTAIVIPNPGGKVINSTPYLEELKGFDTGDWPHVPGTPDVGPSTQMGKDGQPKDGFNRQRKMGEITNLIMDMTLKGGYTEKEMANAVKLSMVIIDAEKHNLNWKGAEKAYDVSGLRRRYQKHDYDNKSGGTSTLVTRAKSEIRVQKRRTLRDSDYDPKTGKLRKDVDLTDYKGGTTYTDKNGKVQQRTQAISKIENAYEQGYTASKLSSGTLMESKYADYADKVKNLEYEARKAYLKREKTPYSKEASIKYKEEVDSLIKKYNDKKSDQAVERKCQTFAKMKLQNKRNEVLGNGGEFDKEDAKKYKNLYLVEARKRFGINKHKMKITPKEWEAITAGALHPSKVREILNACDSDQIKAYATPKDYKSPISASQLAYAKAQINTQRYTYAEIAQTLGISESQLQYALKKNG